MKTSAVNALSFSDGKETGDRRLLTTIGIGLAVGIVYFFSSKLGLSLATIHPSATVVWASSGIAFAAFLLFGYRIWPYIFVSAFLVNLTTAGSAATSLGIAFGNTMEGIVGAYLVNQYANGRHVFDRPQDIFRFIFLAAILSTMVSATFGVTSLTLGGYANWAQYGSIWFTWWLGDMVGDILFAPLLLLVASASYRNHWHSKRALEGIGLFAALIVVGIFVFLGQNPFDYKNAPLEYLTLLPLSWAAFRFGPRGAIISAFIISGIALWGSLHGSGPFVTSDHGESLLFLQAFIGIITVSSLVLAAVVSSRARTEQRLQVQEAVSRILAESTTLKEASPCILQTLCEMAGWEVGAIWTIHRTANELECVEVWHVPLIEIPEFEAVTRQRRFSPGIGLPGRVWSSGKPAWIPDVTKDNNFPRAPIAIRENLHAAFCFPLVLGDGVLGVIECFSREVREPDVNFLQMLKGIGNQIGQFIERRRVQEELRESEERKASILDFALDAIITMDHNGRVLEFNPAAEEILGYRREDAIGKDIADLIILEGQGLEQYLTTREWPMLGKRFEMRAKRLDGSEFPVELSIIRVGDETSPRFTAFMRDTTEEKEATEALRRSERELNDFFDNAHVGLHWVDSKGTILRANVAELSMLGYLPHEYIGHDLSEFHMDLTILQEILDRLRRGEALNDFSARMRCKDGSVREVSITSSAYYEKGEFIHTRCFTRDITNLKKAEQAQARLGAIVESSGDAIVSKDLNGIIRSWNLGAEAIFGYPAEEMIGESIMKLIPPELHSEEMETLAQLRKGERVSHFDTIRVKKDGKRIHVSLTVSPIKDTSGNVIGASKIAREITDRIRAEATLRESERRFRDLILSLPVALYTTDREGRITLFNESAAQLWGRRPDIGRDMWCGSWKILRPDGTSLPLDQCPMAVALKEERSVVGEEILVIRPDESRAYVLPHPEPLRNEAGEIVGAINMLVDITDRKKAENELRKAHEELEVRIRERTAELVDANEELRKRDYELSTAQQIARLGSWEWDLRTSRVTWSEELHTIYGLQPGQFGGDLQSFVGLLHPVDRETTVANIQKSIQTREPFDFEERIVRPNGEIRILHSKGRVVTDETGDVTKLSGVCLDVTERRRAERKFRDLLESAPDAIVITDQEGRIVLVNAQTERLFSYSKTELLGKPSEILLPERFRDANNYYVPIQSLSESTELYGLRKDNTEFPVEVSRSPLETEEGILISTAIRDITEQKLLRSRLVEAERKRSADLRRYAHSVQRAQEEERQRISRELHDDICQRLSGMKLNVEMIADEVAPKDQALSHRLGAFNEQCGDLITEVRRVMVDLRPTMLDDFGLVVALGLLTQQFEKLHKTKVNLEMDASVRLKIEPQLEIALYRIAQEGLSNIGKHAHASTATLALQKHERSIVLSISDNGKGFDLGEDVGRRDVQSGLGLISMRERSELLGGSFSVESTRGAGTTIRVTLPLGAGSRQEATATIFDRGKVISH